MLCPAMFSQQIMRADGQECALLSMLSRSFPISTCMSDQRRQTWHVERLSHRTMPCKTHQSRDTLNPVNHVLLKIVVFPSHLSFGVSLLPGPKHDRSYRSYRS